MQPALTLGFESAKCARKKTNPKGNNPEGRTQRGQQPKETNHNGQLFEGKKTLLHYERLPESMRGWSGFVLPAVTSIPADPEIYFLGGP